MSITEAQYKAQQKYDKAHAKRYLLKLHKENDADIIDWLERQDSKQGAIKRLIREELKKEG